MIGEFKKEIDDVHGQYRVEVEAALPKDLAELEVRINENDDYWKILKYQNTAVQMKTHKTHTDIKNKHLKNMDLEKGRVHKKYCFTYFIVFVEISHTK